MRTAVSNVPRKISFPLPVRMFLMLLRESKSKEEENLGGGFKK